MKEIKIFLDDQADDPEMSYRKTPFGYTPVKTPSDFRKIIEESIASQTKIVAISFDNDLGSDQPEEGQHLLKWLEGSHPEILLNDIELTVHSMNSVAGKRMREEVEKLMNNKDYVKQLIEAKNLPDPWVSMPMR